MKNYSLKKLINALERGKSARVHVGILGDSKPRKGKGLSNAEIGARHEFGVGVPQRSFLRMPLETRLRGEIEKSGTGRFNSYTMRLVLQAGSSKILLERLGKCAEFVIADAFGTEGFGTWAPWSETTRRIKAEKVAAGKINTLQILVESQQLRNSILSEVVGG